MIAVLLSRLMAAVASIPGRVWAGLAGLAAVALILAAVSNRAYDRGAEAMRSRLQPQLDACRTEAADLRAKLDIQTKALRAAREEAEARQQAAQRALRAAEAKARTVTQPARAQLRREQPQPEGGPLTPAQRKAWEALQ